LNKKLDEKLDKLSGQIEKQKLKFKKWCLIFK
jgi:hypothetical protein